MAHSINTVTLNEINYPSLLKEIHEPPQKLYFIGELPRLGEKIIAIVGTRKAGHEGKLIAKRIAKDLASQGILVASGLALGIDAAAHEGALSAKGKTIAILGNGLDEIYPRAHENLAKEILKFGGAIFSEYEPSLPALPHQFLERNRLIAGISIATIVIEAPIHSGALVTAKHALEEGREVFVVPGHATNQNYRGSHMLLRNGARIATSAEEILEDLGFDLEEKNNDTAKELNPDDALIINALNGARESLTLDKIIEATKLQPHVVGQRLTFLMMEEKIFEKNGRFKLKQ